MTFSMKALILGGGSESSLTEGPMEPSLDRSWRSLECQLDLRLVISPQLRYFELRDERGESESTHIGVRGKRGLGLGIGAGVWCENKNCVVFFFYAHKKVLALCVCEAKNRV